MAVLDLYKPEEASRSRGGLAVMVGALFAFGIYSLYEYLGRGFWQTDLIGGVLGDEFPLSPRVILCAVLLVALGVGIYVALNNHKVVDFLIETENEMAKVSWSPQHEVIQSSVVVIGTVVIMMVYLGIVDYLLALFTNNNVIPWREFWNKLLG